MGEKRLKTKIVVSFHTWFCRSPLRHSFQRSLSSGLSLGKTPISPTFKAVRPGLFGGGHGPGGGSSRRYSCSSSLDNHNDVFTFSRTQTASYCDVNSPSSYPSSLRGSPAPYSGSDSISPPTPPMSPAAIGSGGHVPMGSPLRVSARRMLPETPKQRELPSRSDH